jgi:hypothetical protein
MATSKDATRSIEYNSTILAVFGSKSTGISPDRDVLVRFIARGYIVTHNGVKPLNPHRRANTLGPEVRNPAL